MLFFLFSSPKPFLFWGHFHKLAALRLVKLSRLTKFGLGGIEGGQEGLEISGLTHSSEGLSNGKFGYHRIYSITRNKMKQMSLGLEGNS